VAAGKAEKGEEDNRENNDAIAVELTGADKASVFDSALYCCSAAAAAAAPSTRSLGVLLSQNMNRNSFSSEADNLVTSTAT
jgi:hypothetical protein